MGSSELTIFSAHHLYYELDMLFWTVTKVFDGKRRSFRSADRRRLKNALLESFAVHLRNIVSFCYPFPVRADEVIAHDFMPSDVDWEIVRPPLTYHLKNAKERTDKQIAHLTRLRYDGGHPKKAWAPLIEFDDVKKVLHCFISHADRQTLAPNLFEMEFPETPI